MWENSPVRAAGSVSAGDKGRVKVWRTLSLYFLVTSGERDPGGGRAGGGDPACLVQDAPVCCAPKLFPGALLAADGCSLEGGTSPPEHFHLVQSERILIT